MVAQQEGLDLTASPKKKLVLRDYQVDASNAIINALKYYKKPAFAVLATGAGKSIIIADVCHRLNEPVLVLQPSKELLVQNHAKLLMYGITDISMYSASVNQKEISKFTYATIGSIYKHPEKFKHFKHIIIDECLPADTMIGDVAIQDVRVGDTVLSYNHEADKVEPKRVSGVVKKPMRDVLYLISTQAGAIISTDNHPHYVKDKGYTRADEIKEGDVLYAIEETTSSNMQRLLNPVHDNAISKETTGGAPRSVAVPGVLKEKDVRNSVEENDREQPDEVGRIKKEDVTDTTSHRPQAEGAGRKRERLNHTTAKAIEPPRKGMDTGTTYQNDGEEGERRQVSDKLQGGPGKSILNARNRSGRGDSQESKESHEGCKEGREVRAVRVDSITVLERPDIERLGLSDGGDYVYCIEVEGNHNFFANGILTHNCHLVNPKGGMYRSFFKALGVENIIGLTATPYRSDTTYVSMGSGIVKATGTLKMINRIKPFFYKKMLYKIETNELIERGYLSPIDYFIDETDTSDLRINDSGTNFTEDSLEIYADKVVGRTAQIIEGIHERGLAKRNLVFCTSIKRAYDTQEILADMGIRAEVVTGKTPKKERDKLVKQFRDGEFVHMLNVGVFTTGFDVPELDSIILARPTMSLSLYYQMVGRGVRLDPADPNKRLKVYDMSDNVRTMGRVETITLTKEADGFRDCIVTERGRMDNQPLYSFKIKKKEKKNGRDK